MSLKALFSEFHNRLDPLYDKEEVSSFFYILLEHILKMDRVQMALDPDRSLDPVDLDTFKKAIHQLEQHVPVQYITGNAPFFGLNFKVNRDTLIPRPETEELVALLLDELNAFEAREKVRVLDIGTGSGCIAITLKKHCPDSEVLAFDISEKALDIARENAQRHQIAVDFFQNDILNLRRSDQLNPTAKFDVIVSNPPYVRKCEQIRMLPNVLEHEPHSALFVEDNDPLKFYKAICECALNYLISGGKLYLEINEFLGNEMKALLERYGFKAIALRKDVYGKDRMISAVKK